MGKTVHCKCKSGCSNRRCVCLRNNELCDESCGYSNCENPLNGMDVEALSICTIQNIEEYKDLSSDELEEKYKLPCGCEQVPLKDLLGDYICSKCGFVGIKLFKTAALGIVKNVAPAGIGGSSIVKLAIGAPMA